MPGASAQSQLDRAEQPVRESTGSPAELLRTLLFPRSEEADSLVVLIAQWVGQAVVEGRLEPGAEVSSVALARQFRTSRTPVREALHVLAQHGLIEMQPRRRPRVPRMGFAEVCELYQVRASLFSLVCELLAQHASAETLQLLHDSWSAAEVAASAGDVEAHFWHVITFHTLAASLCGNGQLRQMLNRIGLGTLRFRRLAILSGERIDASIADHQSLIRALENHNSELAAALGRSIILLSLGELERMGPERLGLAAPARRGRLPRTLTGTRSRLSTPGLITDH